MPGKVIRHNRLASAATTNPHRIERLRNIHSDQRCFLIGNGPSLNLADLDKLGHDITFACNNIHLAFADTDWRPTYYTVSDPLAAQRYATIISQLALTKIFSDSVKPYFEHAEDIIWLKQIQYERDDDFSDFAFCFDLTKGVYHGATTLYIQLQIALFMGIREVYLLGVDFDYKQPSTAGKRSGLGVIIEYEGEANHFHPDYREPHERWWLANKEFQYKTYSFAKTVYEAYGGRILNASRKTLLDVFPLVELDSIV